jgi:hypothetical protein
MRAISCARADDDTPPPDEIELVLYKFDGACRKYTYVRAPEPAPRFAPVHWHIKDASLDLDATGCWTAAVTLEYDDHRPITLPFGRVVIIPEEDWQP